MLPSSYLDLFLKIFIRIKKYVHVLELWEVFFKLPVAMCQSLNILL